MKNGLGDLNNHLFEQLERLADDEIMSDPKKAAAEIQKAKAVASIAGAITSNARVQLEALQTINDLRIEQEMLPDTLKVKKPLKKIGGK